MVAETTCPVRKRTEVVSEQANQDGTGTVKTVHDLLEDDEANEHRVRLHQLHAGGSQCFFGGGEGYHGNNLALTVKLQLNKLQGVFTTTG